MTDEFTRHDGPRHEGPASTSPYPTSRLAPPHDLVDTAREIQRADQVLGTVVGDKLGRIADQIRALQEEARDVLARAHRDASLHRAECRFQKVVGQMYHLYRNTRTDRLYFSLLSPADWRGAPPDPYVGGFRLEADQSWTAHEEVVTRDARMAGTERLLGTGGPFPGGPGPRG